MKIFCGVLLLAAAACGQTNGLADRVGSTGFIQLRAESFKTLTPRQKELAYWLVEASIAIDPIIYDQLSAYGIREKRLLEGIASHGAGTKQITDFAKLFWANRGNHNENTSQKFLPEGTFEDFQKAAEQAFQNGAFHSSYGDLPQLGSREVLAKEVGELKDALFNAEFEPMITAKSPRGERILSRPARIRSTGLESRWRIWGSSRSIIR